MSFSILRARAGNKCIFFFVRIDIFKLTKPSALGKDLLQPQPIVHFRYHIPICRRTSIFVSSFDVLVGTAATVRNYQLSYILVCEKKVFAKLTGTLQLHGVVRKHSETYSFHNNANTFLTKHGRVALKALPAYPCLYILYIVLLKGNTA